MIGQGLFVTVEGIHGAGKTTIALGLTANLLEQGYQTVYVPDQTATTIGTELRRINLSSGNVAPLTECFIVAAARHQSVEEVIKPNLEKGIFVVCERFTDAFTAYQAYGRGMRRRFVELIGQAMADGMRPDLTILLDLDPSASLDRIPRSKRHRFEMENLEFHTRLREGYLQLAKDQPRRIKVIDASAPRDTVLAKAWDNIAEVVLHLHQGT